jgi:hypothetical protein
MTRPLTTIALPATADTLTPDGSIGCRSVTAHSSGPGSTGPSGGGGAHADLGGRAPCSRPSAFADDDEEGAEGDGAMRRIRRGRGGGWEEGAGGGAAGAGSGVSC